MKQGSTLSLKIVIVLLGLIVFGLCTFPLPALMRFGMYRHLAIGMYMPAILFFLILHQAWKQVSYIETNTTFSVRSVRTLGRIKYYALTISALYAVAMPYMYRVSKQDNGSWVVVLGLVFMFGTLVIAIFVAVLQKPLQSAIDIKSENDLTV